MANGEWPVYGEITGPIVMIGFGSIGRGTLPLIERHFKFDKSRLVVIDPSDEYKSHALKRMAPASSTPQSPARTTRNC